MKKNLLVSITLSALLLGACGNGPVEEVTSMEETQMESVEEEPEETTDVDEEVDTSNIKEDAINLSFVDANSGNIDTNTLVRLVGVPSNFSGDRELFTIFDLTTEEDGGSGMYIIRDFDPESELFKEGETIEIWGTYAGKNENSGMPMITAEIIEQQTNKEVESNKGTRSNPYQVGEAATLDVVYSDPDYNEIHGEIELTLIDIVFGQEAYDFLIQENSFNEEAPETLQWALIDNQITLLEGSEDYPYNVDLYVDVYDSEGASVNQSDAYASLTDRLSEQSIFPGATTNGFSTLFVPENEEGTLIMLETSADHAWFQLK